MREGAGVAELWPNVSVVAVPSISKSTKQSLIRLRPEYEVPWLLRKAVIDLYFANH